jgi:hypothetical protein
LSPAPATGSGKENGLMCKLHRKFSFVNPVSVEIRCDSDFQISQNPNHLNASYTVDPSLGAFWLRLSCKVVEHKTHNPLIEGLNPATGAGRVNQRSNNNKNGSF